MKDLFNFEVEEPEAHSQANESRGDRFIFETGRLDVDSADQGLGQMGYWIRQGGRTIVLPDTGPLPEGQEQEVYEVSGGRMSSATLRVLTYSTKDVIDNRISIPAQHSLVRLSKNPATRADAVEMLEAVKGGRLAGIFCVNWQKSAQRALRLGKSWWTVIPQVEDAVLMLDPDDPLSGPPLIGFRRELDPDCGPLKGEKRFVASPGRLDAALRKAWTTFLLLKSGRLRKCELPDGPVALGASSTDAEIVAIPLANIFPPMFCQRVGGRRQQPPGPSSPALVTHTHIRRTCITPPNWISDASPIVLTARDLNPGFMTPSDQIDFDAKLDAALVNLMVTKYAKMLAKESVTSRSPSSGDKIRVALVDLTGNKLCKPGFAGWGSTQTMPGGSTAKIGLFYAAHQLVFDLQQLARAKGIRTTSDLLREADDSLKSLSCKPDLKWLLKLDETVNPIGIEQSVKLAQHLLDIVEERNSTVRASELIMRLGFDYMASLFLQSGLRHPTRAGLWLGGTYCTGRTAAPINTKCHALQSCGSKVPQRIIWTRDPLKIKSIVLTALSTATFFTLLAQGRLVTEALSLKIESLLKRACSGFQAVFRSGVPGAKIRAEKCGLTSTVLHEAALIEKGTRRYVVVYLTERANLSVSDRKQLAADLDQLIEDNNP